MPILPASRSAGHLVWRWVAALVVAGGMGFGMTGLRAVAFQAGALQPGLEGVDVQVVGVVAAMPQRSEAGLRLRLQVESARFGGQPVALPDQIFLSWYGGLLRSEDPASVPFAQLQQGLGTCAQVSAGPLPCA